MTIKTEPVTKSSRAHTRYKTSDGKRVPGATTITGMLEKRGLYKWHNQMGLQGIDTSKYVDNLANIGKCAHLMISSEWKKEGADLSEYTPQEIDRAENALISYWNWEKGHDIKPIMVEAPLVDDEYGYGGTLDCYADVDGLKTLLDLKTSKGIFPEMIMQIAAYYHLLLRHDKPIESVRILRVGRDESEGFEDHVIDLDDLVPHSKKFFLLLEIYKLDKEIKKKGA